MSSTRKKDPDYETPTQRRERLDECGKLEHFLHYRRSLMQGKNAKKRAEAEQTAAEAFSTQNCSQMSDTSHLSSEETAQDLSPQVFVKACLWTFNNLGKESVTISKAPSTGAFALWTWTKKNPANLTAFLTTLMPRACPNKYETEEKDSLPNDSARNLTRIDNMLKQRLSDSNIRLDEEEQDAFTYEESDLEGSHLEDGISGEGVQG